jgi:hypothetical protein
LVITARSLAKWRIFTTNVDAENQILINRKTVCGALYRHFCQTAVTGSKIFVRHFVLIIFCSFILNKKSAILCVSLIENVGLK